MLGSDEESSTEEEEDNIFGEDEGESKTKQTKKVKKKGKRGRKSTWSTTQLDDFIDIVVSSDEYKNKLIFENSKNKRNGQVYESILAELKKRAKERKEDVAFSIGQLRTKFKKCVGECKKVALTIKTASGIGRYIDSKGYGAWFNKLFQLVKTRDSCQPEKALEVSTSSLNESGESIETDEQLFVPVKKKPKKKMKKDSDSELSEAIDLMKKVVENDPTKDFINFLKEDMERSREHELRLVQMLLSHNASPYEQSSYYHQQQPSTSNPSAYY